MADRVYTGEISLVEKGIPPVIKTHLVIGNTNNTMVSAHKTNKQTLTHNVPAYITGFTEAFDIGSNFDATNGIYTALVTGYYFATFTGLFEDTNSHLTVAAVYIECSSGVNIRGSYWCGPDGIVYGGSSASGLVYMTAAQTLKFGGYMCTADTNTADIYNGEYTNLSVSLVAKG